MGYLHPSEQELKAILSEAKRIAVVGISDKPDRASYGVSVYMKQAGYEIIPVNPQLSEVLDTKVYSSLEEIEGKVDIVNVFRRSEFTVPVVESAIAIGAKVVWLQLGIYNEEAYRLANDAGLDIVMDRCIKIDHMKLF